MKVRFMSFKDYKRDQTRAYKIDKCKSQTSSCELQALGCISQGMHQAPREYGSSGRSGSP